MKGFQMCDAHEDDVLTIEAQQNERRRRIMEDAFGGCEAHGRSQAESEAICRDQGCVPNNEGRCICCGK